LTAKKSIEDMAFDELIAELNKLDPKALRAALEAALIDAGLTNADLRALLEAAAKLSGPTKN
jgi:hypothetical protein